MTALRPVHACAAVTAAACLCVTLWTGLRDARVALAFGVLIAVGELTR